MVKKTKSIGKVSGWARKGRPFSISEFKRSHIKTAHKMTYPEYLKEVSQEIKGKKLRHKQFRKIYGFK